MVSKLLPVVVAAAGAYHARCCLVGAILMGPVFNVVDSVVGHILPEPAEQ